MVFVLLRSWLILPVLCRLFALSMKRSNKLLRRVSPYILKGIGFYFFYDNKFEQLTCSNLCFYEKNKKIAMAKCVCNSG